MLAQGARPSTSRGALPSHRLQTLRRGQQSWGPLGNPGPGQWRPLARRMGSEEDALKICPGPRDGKG